MQFNEKAFSLMILNMSYLQYSSDVNNKIKCIFVLSPN